MKRFAKWTLVAGILALPFILSVRSGQADYDPNDPVDFCYTGRSGNSGVVFRDIPFWLGDGLEQRGRGSLKFNVEKGQSIIGQQKFDRCNTDSCDD